MPFSGEKGRMVANPRHRASDLCAGKRLISLSEAMFRARFPLKRGKPALNRPPFVKSGRRGRWTGFQPSHRPDYPRCAGACYLPTSVATPVPWRSSLAAAREASLRRYAAVAGHVPDTLCGCRTIPWGTGRLTWLTRG